MQVQIRAENRGYCKHSPVDEWIDKYWTQVTDQMNFDDTCPSRAAGSTSASSPEGPEGSLPSEINQPESSQHVQSREIHGDREKNRYFQVWGEEEMGNFLYLTSTEVLVL